MTLTAHQWAVRLYEAWAACQPESARWSALHEEEHDRWLEVARVAMALAGWQPAQVPITRWQP